MHRFLPLTVLLWSVVCPAASQAQTAGSPPDTDSAGAVFKISRSLSRLEIEGDASSVAHEAILRESVNRFFGAEELRSVSIDLRNPVHSPPGWALITDMVLRAVSATRSATVEITESGVRIRGVTSTAADWEAVNST